jgi:hypothetical protein
MKVRPLFETDRTGTHDEFFECMRQLIVVSLRIGRPVRSIGVQTASEVVKNGSSDFSIIGGFRLGTSRIGCSIDSSCEGTYEVLARRPRIVTVNNVGLLRQVDPLLCHDIVEGLLQFFDILSICEMCSVFFPGLFQHVSHGVNKFNAIILSS